MRSAGLPQVENQSDIKFSRMRAEDCLSPDPRGRVEGGHGIVEGNDLADVGAQATLAEALDDLA